MSKKKIVITTIVIIVLAIITAIFKVEFNQKEIEQISDTAGMVVDKIEQITENDSTTEIPEMTEEDEIELETQEVEDEGFELQGEIAYEGSQSKNWNLNVGDTPQLTYISQIDSRWRYYAYTSIGDSSQTIGSSGCGVASAAMIIDSIVGNVDVKELADTFVKHGYRSANSGTYWSAYRAVADEFDIEYKETFNIDVMLELLRNNNYIIASCGNGLFTSNGHYIVLYGVEGDMIKIYDPYLYAGKFDTSTRRGKVDVSGNTVYCSIDNFKNYANYKQFFCYKYNPNKVETTNTTDNKVTTTTYTRYVKVNTSLNVRNAPNGEKIGSLYNNNKVTIFETNGEWSKIGENRWVSSRYLVSSITPTIQAKSTKKYTTGKYVVNTNIHVRTGPGTNYNAKTYTQLTYNARAQNKKFGNYYYNGYRKGVICNVTQVRNNWGKTASGWICLNYCGKR